MPGSTAGRSATGRFTAGRLKVLIFISLLVVALLVLASFLYFRAGRGIPEGADVVKTRTAGSPGGEIAAAVAVPAESARAAGGPGGGCWPGGR